MRNALVYVLGNVRKHRPWLDIKGSLIDVYSSGPYFLGFVEFPGCMPSERKPNLVPRALGSPGGCPTARPETWLLAHGWKQRGLISVFEAPARRVTSTWRS
ncbi:MAG: hypothetical protein ACOY0T_34510 [Myxococcota bacterium]